MPPTDLCSHASSSFPLNPLFLSCLYIEASFPFNHKLLLTILTLFFSSKVPPLNVSSVWYFCTLSGDVKYTSTFHLLTHLCKVCLLVRGGFAWSWAKRHISLGRGPQGTPVNRCSWSSVFSQQGRRSDQCCGVCILKSVCLSDLTAKKPYGQIYLFF